MPCPAITYTKSGKPSLLKSATCTAPFPLTPEKSIPDGTAIVENVIWARARLGEPVNNTIPIVVKIIIRKEADRNVKGCLEDFNTIMFVKFGSVVTRVLVSWFKKHEYKFK